MFVNDDQEMNRIYQESLHPKDYSEDGAYNNQKVKKNVVKNAFKQDVHGNVNKYSANKRVKTTNYNENTKTVTSVMTIIGIIIITLVFIILPMIISK